MGYLQGIKAEIQYVTRDGAVFSHLVVTGRESRPLPPYYSAHPGEVLERKEAEGGEPSGGQEYSACKTGTNEREMKEFKEVKGIREVNLFIGQNSRGLHKPWRWS